MNAEKLKAEINNVLKALGCENEEYAENGLWNDVESIIAKKYGVDENDDDAYNDFHAAFIFAVYMA